MPAETHIPTDRMLTPPAIAERLGVSLDKVYGWLLAGELRGVNVANRSSRRPRYRIDPADLEAFLRSRAVTAPAPAPTRRKRTAAAVVEYV